MKIKVYQSEQGEYVEMESMGKIKYIGESFGVDELTNGKVYECLGFDSGMLRVMDDSDEDYLYSVVNPRPTDGSSKGGKWEIVEDDEKGTLTELFNSIKK